MRIVVIIPALNEELALPKVLEEIPVSLVEEVIVVDNGSRDRTAEMARSAGATVLKEQRLGYGQACLTGIAQLARKPPDIVVFMDADYSDRPAELPALLEPILSKEADFVLGSRVLGHRERGALAPHVRLGNWLATILIRLLFGYRYTDMGPFRVIRYDTLISLNMQDRDYGWTAEMQAKAARSRVSSVEVPVSYHCRIGRSKISGTLKGTVLAGWKIITTIFKIRFAPQPTLSQPNTKVT